jgi:hypothetical protein
MEDNFKMDLEELGWEVCTEFIWLWLGTVGGSFVNTVMTSAASRHNGVRDAPNVIAQQAAFDSFIDLCVIYL